MIILIKHKVDWELIHQLNQTQINKDHICENNKIFYNDYKVGDKVMIDNHDTQKYETPYNVPFATTKCWTNSTVTLQYGVTKIRYNIFHIKPYTPDKCFEDINS